MRLANALVGNAADAAALEVTLVGPELRFEQPTRRRGRGRRPRARRSTARRCRSRRRVRAPAGSVLRFGERRRGARAYVAFDGGIDVPRVLGSRATHVVSGLGGIDGRALRAGDRLPSGEPGAAIAPAARARRCARTLPRGGARLRVLPGRRTTAFHDAALDALQRTRFTISPQSNRMGYRLTRTPIAAAAPDRAR